MQNVSYYSALVLIITSTVTQAQPSHLKQVHNWSWGDLTEDIGLAVLDSADMNGDGSVDIIASGDTRSPFTSKSIHIIDSNLNSTICFAEFNLIPLEGSIWDVDQDNVPELVVSFYNETVVLDGSTCLPETSHQYPAGIDTAAFGDYDEDGVLDIAFPKDGNLHISQWNDTGNPRILTGLGGETVQAVSVNDQSRTDLAIFDDSLRILRGSDLMTIHQMNPPPDYAQYARLGSGNTPHLIIGYEWELGIEAIDMSTGSTLFSYSYPNIDALATGDINSDNIDEILIGSGFSAGITLLDSEGTYLRSINEDTNESGTPSIHVNDIDNTYPPEVIWGGGNASSGPDRLHIADPITADILVSTEDRGAPYYLGGKSDYTGNGKAELAISYRESEENPPTAGVLLLEPATGDILFDIPALVTDSRVTSISSGDLTDDQTTEVCMGYGYFDYYIGCQDPSGTMPGWSIEVPEWADLMRIVEDGAGSQQLVASFDDDIRSYNPLTGTANWVSQGIPGGAGSAQDDNIFFYEGKIFVIRQNETFVLDPENGTTLKRISKNRIDDMIPFGGGLVAAIYGQGVGFYDYESEQITEMLFSTTNRTKTIRASPGGDYFFFTTSPEFGASEHAYLADKAYGLSPVYLGRLHVNDALALDGREIILTSEYGVRSYTFTLPEQFFSDGFE